MKDRNSKLARDCRPKGPCNKFFYTTKNTRVCEHAGCTTQPSFAPVGTPYLRCKKHKKHGDVNVRIRKCEFGSCMIVPSFGPFGQTKGIRCFKHKLDTDINTILKLCEFSGCKVSASFGPIGTRKMLRCYQHKHSGDINTKKNPIELVQPLEAEQSLEDDDLSESTKNLQRIISGESPTKTLSKLSRGMKNEPEAIVVEDFTD